MSDAIGTYRHWVRLQGPGAPVPDGDGGFTQPWADLVPAGVKASIEAPTARDLERLAAGTVITSANKVLTCRFHPGLTAESRVSWVDAAGRPHVANVLGVDNPGERCLRSVALLVEVYDAVPLEDTSWIQQGWLQ